ncbi:MAG: DNA-processing protein DprA [Patescibacteria group bacterium]|nr:DNA-processing protein DprA [Patescibacteria group bacterium]
MIERDYWLGWSVFPGVGPGKFKKILSEFGSAKEAWKADQLDLKNVIGEKLALDFEKFRKVFSIENYLEKLEKKNVWFLTQKDKEYPQLLLQTDRSPIVLYGKGADSVGDSNLFASELAPQSGAQTCTRCTNPNHLPSKTVAVVGTRKITSYGREVTEILTRDLVQNGFMIVSGLAMGVDAVSHKTAIENNGKTIAVLGCGVDLCYPSSNKKLYDEIISGNGAIVSEYPIGMTPSVGSFPSRNRIIAGLSQGVLVTEGAQDSGSLITADYAIKYQRKVFAVPGQITSSLAKGPNQLISKGAKLVTNANDILQELKSEYRNSKFETNSRPKADQPLAEKIQNATEEETKILEILENEAVHFDEIVRKTGFNSSKLGTILTLMEIKGMIKSLESGFFSVVN